MANAILFPQILQKAEILKLRLSLATYKVKTNQTDVPLDKLQIRPVPGMTQRRGPPLPSMSAHTVQRTTPAQYWYRSLPASQTLDKDSDDGDDDDENESVEDREGERGTRLEQSALLQKSGVLSTPPKRRNLEEEEEEEEARLMSSGVRGGAAKGLLSLSQASS